jgi:hypothetical protein
MLCTETRTVLRGEEGDEALLLPGQLDGTTQG